MMRSLSENGTCSTCGNYCRCKIIRDNRVMTWTCKRCERAGQ